jgi:PPOX class probable F420-dependent enzyme
MATISDPKLAVILNGRRVATLATENEDGSIHLTAVWYLAEGDSIFIGTSSSSRKGRNLAARPKASLMVDVRQPGRERGVSVAGTVEIIRGPKARELNLRIQHRYLSPTAIEDPRLGPKLLDMDDVTIRLKPASVFSWDMEALDAAVFGGAFSKPGYVLAIEP